MQDTSAAFRRAVALNTTFRIKAALTLASGTKLSLTGDDFMMDGNSFERATSSVNSFDIGSAIIGKAVLVLNNIDDRFSDYDFRGASITVHVGVPIEVADDGTETVEWIEMGIFNVEQPDAYAGTVQLKCYDNLSLLEKPYSSVKTAYPATLAKIVSDLCDTCGVLLATQTFQNSDYTVAKRPDDSNLSCLDVLSYAAQVSGNFARADTKGRIHVEWYDLEKLAAADSLDGGLFTEDRDEADGGWFTDKEYEVEYDGGNFTDRDFVIIYQHSQLTVSTDDVIVTGVTVKAADSDGETWVEGESYTYGATGYVLSIEGNPLVRYGQAQTVAKRIGPNVVGMKFRPFTASTLGDPSVEAGDAVVVLDQKQRQYPALITSQTFDLNGWAHISCEAEKPSVRLTSSSGALTKVAQSLQNANGAAMSAIDAVAQAAAEAAQAVADAVAQHFFADESGVHVTSSEGDATTGRNILVNSLGILLRNGTRYLLGLTDSGTAIYDGNGNDESNIVSLFGATQMTIGKSNERHVTVSDSGFSLFDKLSHIATILVSDKGNYGSAAIDFGSGTTGTGRVPSGTSSVITRREKNKALGLSGYDVVLVGQAEGDEFLFTSGDYVPVAIAPSGAAVYGGFMVSGELSLNDSLYVYGESRSSDPTELEPYAMQVGDENDGARFYVDWDGAIHTDKSLEIGSTTLTEAQLKLLLNLI